MHLFEHAAGLLEVARAASGALSERDAPSGHVRLNAPATVHRGLLARAIAGLLFKEPAVSVSVTLDDRLVDLVDGDYDRRASGDSGGTAELRRAQARKRPHRGRGVTRVPIAVTGSN